VPYKFSAIRHALDRGVLRDGLLPAGYGFRLDERIVEYPWLFSRLPPGVGNLLDAGSVLNYQFLLAQPGLAEKRIFISTLAPETYYYPPAAGGISHFFIAWGTNSHFGPPEVAVTGSYEFTVTATDATGSGWEFMVPFEVE
jgi:hypothetical protein